MHSNAGNLGRSRRYSVLDPVKYNSYVQGLIQDQEEINYGNNLRKSELQGQLIARLGGLICGEKDIVFSNIEEDERTGIALSLDTADERLAESLNYVLLFAADECILKSSPASGGSVKVTLRVIPDLKRPIKEVYYDKSCDCIFKRGDASANQHHEFKVYCGPGPAKTSVESVQEEEEEDYLELGGVDTVSENELISLPVKAPSRNSDARRENQPATLPKTPAEPPLTDRDEVTRLKETLPNFSDYFWNPSAEFFGEGPIIGDTTELQSDGPKDRHQNGKPHENWKQGTKLERELRESCNSREYRLILNTLLTILNKLIEHLDHI